MIFAPSQNFNKENTKLIKKYDEVGFQREELIELKEHLFKVVNIDTSQGLMLLKLLHTPGNWRRKA
jgi:hypothetical protein